jgi:ankyrin repeat protein
MDWAFAVACENGYIDIFKFLIENKVDVHEGNDYPLMLASYGGHIEMVKILLKMGANVHRNNNLVFGWAVDNEEVSAKTQLNIVKLLKLYAKKPIERNSNIKKFKKYIYDQTS